MIVKRTVLTMVGGTWARNAPWIQEDSLISRYLVDHLPGETQICSFSWAGNNRHSARLDAARDLQEQIKATKRGYADNDEEIDHFVIAHSHGGNVAMLACKDPEVERSLNGVICMATPFLYFRHSIAAFGLSFFGGLAWFLFFTLWLSRLLTAGLDMTDNSLPDWVYGLGITALISLFGFSFILSNGKRSSLKLLEGLSLPEMARDKVLIIRSVGDEAGGVLAGTAMAAWLTVFLYSLPYRILKGIGKVILRYRVTMLVVALSVMGLAGIKHVKSFNLSFLTLSEQMQLWINLIAISVFVLLPAALAAIRFVLTMSSGYDIPFRYGQFMVTAEAIPTTGTYSVKLIRARSDTVRSVEEVPLRASSPRSSWEAMKHSEIYEHPKAVDYIASWVAERKNRSGGESS